jgi:hypothetical protein
MIQTKNVCSETGLVLYEHKGEMYVTRLDIANCFSVLTHDEAERIISRLIPLRANVNRYYYRYPEFLEALGVIFQERRAATPVSKKHARERFGDSWLARWIDGRPVPYSQAWEVYKNGKV